MAKGQAGAGLDGVGVVEDSAEFVVGGGVAWRGQRVEADVQCAVVGGMMSPEPVRAVRIRECASWSARV